LIKALSIARQNNREVKALIVGHEMENGYRQVLIDLAESLGVRDSIVFNDFVVNPQELMQICDGICLTTYEETFGLVLPEAMRAGIAVIGSDKGGVPEIIDHLKTGLLFESKNEASLYQQIARLYDDPALKQQLASEGRKKADSMFDNDQHFNKLETILSDVIKK
jgi:glycosyltransferase involved in cell wall biosynthesis